MKKILFVLLCVCIASSAQAQLGDLLSASNSGAARAINRHNSNQILDYVSQCAVAVQTKRGGIINPKDTCGSLLPYMDPPFSLEGRKFTISEDKKSGSTFIITTPEIESEKVRKNVLQRSNSIFDIKEAGKKVKFIFRK